MEFDCLVGILMLNGLHRRLTYLARAPLLTLGTPRGPSPLRPDQRAPGRTSARGAAARIAVVGRGVPHTGVKII
jgi:hypothetical protein